MDLRLRVARRPAAPAHVIGGATCRWPVHLPMRDQWPTLPTTQQLQRRMSSSCRVERAATRPQTDGIPGLQVGATVQQKPNHMVIVTTSSRHEWRSAILHRCSVHRFSSGQPPHRPPRPSRAAIPALRAAQDALVDSVQHEHSPLWAAPPRALSALLPFHADGGRGLTRSLASRSAPRSSSNPTTSAWPPVAASMSAVQSSCIRSNR